LGLPLGERIRAWIAFLGLSPRADLDRRSRRPASSRSACARP